MKKPALLPHDTVIHGDCIEHMKSFPPESVDFILTDPPYIARCRSRDNQTVQNDDNAAWLAPSFAEMYRVLKLDALPSWDPRTTVHSSSVTAS